MARKETNFKQTDIGLIPHDWEVISLGQIGDVKMCKRIFKSQTKETGEIPFYKIGTFGQTPDAFISRSIFERYKANYSYPSLGAILLSASGTIGRRVKYKGEDAYYQDSNIVWLSHNEDKVLNDYLYYAYSRVNWTTEKGAAITRLYNKLFLSAMIPQPPIEEQERIAEVLSHFDEHIDKLVALLEKRKQVKAATMHALLSGSIRLPGFTTPWVNKYMFEFTSAKRGEILVSNDFKHGAIPVIGGGTTIAGFHNKANREGKTITISASGANAGYVGFYTMPIFASDCCTLSESKVYDIEYLYQYLKSIQTNIYRLQTGGAQPHIYPKDIESLWISMPLSVNEQSSIATVLSNMDRGIESLEREIKKYRQMKEGAMEELLTGKTRLL